MPSKYQALQDAVVRLARENPDFVYTKYGSDDKTYECSYFPDEHNPQGCIIGAALRAIGVKPRPLDEGSCAEHVITYHLGEPGDDDEEAKMMLHWFDTVQELQDQGRSWGSCVEPA